MGIQEIEEILARIKNKKQVEGFIIANVRGEIVKTTYKGEKKSEGDRIIANLGDLIFKAKSFISSIYQGNELEFMRIKTKMNELLITPDKENEYIFVLVQSLNIKTGEEMNENVN